MSVIAARGGAYGTGYQGDESLGERIREALATHRGCASSDVMFQENKEKYYNPSAPQTADDDLVEVFNIMRNLNQQALYVPLMVRRLGQKLQQNTRMLHRWCAFDITQHPLHI